MSALTANFKHLYQQPKILIWYIILLPFVVISWFYMPESYGKYIMSLTFNIFFGVEGGFFQREIFHKPFSFCLPGHMKVSRKYMFLIALIVNVLLGIVFMFYGGFEFSGLLLDVLAVCVFGIAVYSLLALMVLFDLEFIAVFLVPAELLFFGLGNEKYNNLLSDIIESYPLVIIVVSGGICWFGWRVLGTEIMRRKHCGKVKRKSADGLSYYEPYYFPEETSTQEKVIETEVVDLSERVDEFLLRRIKQSRQGSLSQYVWGSFYRKEGSITLLNFSGIKWYALFMLLMLLFACYKVPELGVFVIIISLSRVLPDKLSVSSNMLIVGGREERFNADLAVTFIAAVLGTIVAIIIISVTHILAMFMPSFTFRGNEYIFNAIDLKFSLVPLVICPFMYLILLGNKKNVSFKACCVAVALIAVICAAGIWLMGDNYLRIDVIAVVTLLAWAVYILVLRYICKRGCLVS